MWANFDSEFSSSSMEGPAPTVPFGPVVGIVTNISILCPECSPSCFPWCFWFPPPPPPVEMMSSHESDPTFSPLVIAIIGILVSAFLLVSYYTLVARYCTNWEALRRRLRRGGGGHGGRFGDEDDSMNIASGDSWPVFRDGLEESLIKSIPAYKYSRNNAELLQDYCSDCTVCLSEFREEETVRVLPKCSHVFHMSCIDKWLQSHSSCPLCRANIVSPPAAVPEAATRVTVPDEDFRSANRSFRDHISSSNYSNNSSHNGDLQGYREQGCSNNHGCSQQHQQDFRAMSDLASRHRADHRVAELRSEFQPMRRSVSLSAASSLFVSMEIIQNGGGVGFGFEDKNCSEVYSQRKRNGHGSKRFDKGKISAAAAAGGGEGSRSGILHHVMGPLAMKRSFSGTRMLLSRSRNSILPL